MRRRGLKPPPNPHECKITDCGPSFEWPWSVYCVSCRIYLSIYRFREDAVARATQHEQCGGRPGLL